MSDNFINLCSNGDALPEEIDNFIEAWHKSSSTTDLHDYLGMTWEEYSAWAIDKSVLNIIITARIRKIDYKDILVEDKGVELAARSQSSAHTRRLIEWLKRSQYL